MPRLILSYTVGVCWKTHVYKRRHILGLAAAVILWYKISGSRTQEATGEVPDAVSNAKSEDIPASAKQTMAEVVIKHEMKLQFKVGDKTVTVAYREVKPESPKLDILLLHGMSFKSETWVSEPVFTLQLLYQHGYRAVAVDLPGFGDSPSADINNVAFLESFIAATKLQTPVIVSPSMSGSFSLPYLFKDSGNVLSRSRGFVPLAPGGTEKFSDSFSKLKIPTLIIYGSKDKGIGVTAVRNLKKLPQNEVVELQDAGHACYMNKPKEFNDHLLKFLNSLV